MPINTRSELTIDVKNSIAKAYDASLSPKEEEETRDHLAFILPRLKEPNTLIEPVHMALLAIQGRTAKKHWYEKPLGLLLIAITGGVIVAGIVYRLGWNK